MYRRLIFTIIILLICISSSWGQIDNSQWARNFGPAGVSGTVKALKRWGDTLVVAGDSYGLRATVAYSPGFLMFDLIERSWKLQSGDQMDLGDEVRALEVMPNGDLVVGGDFSFTSDGYTLENIAVYRKDGTWSTLSGDTSDFCQGPVNALLEYGDRLYIGGEFYQIGNVDTIFTGFFARWTENSGFLGTEDLIGAPGPGANPAVYALAHGPGPSGIEIDQRIYIGGSFYRFPDDTLGNIAYLETFSGYVYPLGGGTNGPVYALDRPLNSGSGSQLYIGGEFTVAGNSAVQNCATFNTNSNIWNPLGDGLNGPVYSIKQYPGSGSPIRFAGDFDSSSTMAVGAIPGWNYTTGSWETTALTTDAPVYAMEGIGGDFLAVGGEFEFAGDSSLFYGVFMARDPLLSDPDQLWSLGDGLEIYDSPDEGANDVAVDDEGNFYIVGAFDYAGGRLVNNVAKWDGRKWRALGEGIDGHAVKIAVNGDTVYAAHRFRVGNVITYDIKMWDGMQWSTLPGEMPNGTINKMVVDTAGDLYIGGANLDGIGVPDANALVRWDGSQWSALGGPMSDPDTGPQVYDILVASFTNDIYVCGTFAFVDGVVARNVAKWDGSTWTGLGNPKTGNGRPYVIERSPEQSLIISGFLDPPTFVTQYGDSAWIQYAGGVSVPDVSDLLTIGCHVYITGDPLLYVGTEADPFPVRNVGRWDGLQWDSLGSGTNGGIFAMAAHGEQLAVAGDFDIAGGQYTRGFSTWNGVTRGDAATDLVLLTPTANDTLEFGTCFEFTWDTTTSAEEVSVEISLDSGATWNIIHNKANAKRGRLPWVVPDTNASFCKVRIANGDSPCASVEPMFTFSIISDPTIESWWLTHAGGTYYDEPFLPGYTGFNFSNAEANQWPDSVWKNIDYSGFENPPDTIKNFPDWFLYAEAFGDDWSFRNGNPDRPRSKAVKHWQSILMDWGGSCLGFSTASLLWLLGNEFNTDLIVPYEPLYYLEYNAFTRNAANKLWIYQKGEKHQEQDIEASNTLTPIQTLELIKEKFTADYPRTLSFSWRDWKNKLDDDSIVVDSVWKTNGHNVVPYHIINVPDSLGIYYMYYYDPNSPVDLNRWARIDSINGLWRMSNYRTNDTNSRIIPRLPINEYYGYANDDRVTTGLKNYLTSHLIQVYTSASEEILMIDSLGNQIGWMNNEAIVNGLEGGPIFPDDPDYPYDYPSGYLIPYGSYRIELSSFESDETRFSWFGDTTTYFYHRDSTLNDQNDILVIGDNAISVVNNSDLKEKVSFGMIKTTDSTERFVQLSEMTFSPIDSMEMKLDSTGAILLSNTGISRSFSLLLWNSEASMGEDEIKQSLYNILINGNTNQKIVPPWGDLESQPVLLLLDSDQNGVYEDTSVVDVSTDINDEESVILPNTYHLAQNYPNPFNPSTTIEYSLPRKGTVVIEVFNIRGQTVRTLVDRDMPAGSHTVVWDGKNQAKQSVATGVYFYRMRIGERVLTKKMLLLK